MSAADDRYNQSEKGGGRDRPATRTAPRAEQPYVSLTHDTKQPRLGSFATTSANRRCPSSAVCWSLA